MSPALANFLFEVVNFLLLAGALGYLFFRPVREALDREREGRMKLDQERARLLEEAESLNREARIARQTVDEELELRRERLLSAAQLDLARLHDRAEQAQSAQRNAFEQELSAAREAETHALAATLGRLAAASVTRLLGSIDGPDLDASLVRAACAELRRIPKSARTSVSIEAAHPLSADSRTQLEELLGPSLSVRLVDALGAGVRITTGVGQIDATAVAFARLAAREVTQAVAGPPRTTTDE